jgi:hypothetical protein
MGGVIPPFPLVKEQLASLGHAYTAVDFLHTKTRDGYTCFYIQEGVYQSTL